MIGQGRPRAWNLCGIVRLLMRTFGRPLQLLVLGLSLGVLTAGGLTSEGMAEELDVRLRLAWGSGDSAKHRWVGRISCADAKMSDLQPLGIESDAPAAIQLVDNQLVVDPWEERRFDGCDVTIVGDGQSLVRFELRSDQSSTPTVVEVPLEKLAREQVRAPIDSLGSLLLVYRCPGDRFRVLETRENLIFAPGEIWPLRLKTDFAAELAAGPVSVDIILRAIGSDAVLWQATQMVSADSPAPDQVTVDIACPTVEGAYRVSLSASAEQSFATRFVPGQGLKPFASREIDLVVIDPAAKLPPLADQWVPVLSIDPANPGWWQRLPTWAQVSRLTGKPPGSLGNVRLLARPDDPHGLVELAPSVNTHDPSWQSFALPIQEVGAPHLVEIAYPLAQTQRLGISIIEPDAAGRVSSVMLDSGFSVDEVVEAVSGQIGIHRILFWPRTQSPQLMIVNRHPVKPGVFGKITLLRQDRAVSSPADANSDASSPNRLVAGYIAKPVFPHNFDAAEVLDPASGGSVQSWSTFLNGAHRLTQYMKLSGYTGALVSVMADGSALYPSEFLAPSPRYDTGMLAASGQDPIRKDVLKMLLQVCDRENFCIVPTLQLATPLPRIEALRRAAGSQHTSTVWFNDHGQRLNEVRANSRAANYNLLDPQVQDEIAAVVGELLEKCGGHPSCAGLALQLDSKGYGTLPGLEWGFDETTLAAFAADTGITIPAGEGRAAERSRALLDEHRTEWQAWRIKKVTAFYRRLAEQVAAQRSDLKLILTTEKLFAEPTLEQAIRRSVSQPGRLAELLAERGIDLAQLAAVPGIEITSVRRPDSPDQLQQRVSEVVVNEAMQHQELLPQGIGMVFHDVSLSRLASFDQQSPFGADRTHLVLAHLPERTATSFSTDASIIIEGGDYMSMALDADHARQLRSLAQLPAEATETKVVTDQHIEISVTRTSEEAFLICSNPSPWSVNGKLELEILADTTWQLLGDVDLEGSPRGRLSTGRTTWPISLAPHGKQVWKFSTRQIRPGEMRIAANSAAHHYLDQKIQELEARTGNLSIEREYTQLQNPGFEMEGGESRIFGWQPRKGAHGLVELETTAPYAGDRALRLVSQDPLGVAVQSHLFPLPETGMLVVAAHVRISAGDDNSMLTMAVETDEQEQTYRRTRTISLGDDFNSQWKRCELTVNDLPVGDADQIRVQFHLTGNADLMLDEVKLCDLRFDDQRRSEVVKRVFAAKTALEEGHYAACHRLLNEYWSQYLVEYVPPLAREPATLAQQPDNPDPSSTEEKSKGGRLRSIIPRIWR